MTRAERDDRQYHLYRPYDPAIDALESYNEAVRAVGARVRAGEPLPAFFLSSRVEPAP